MATSSACCNISLCFYMRRLSSFSVWRTYINTLRSSFRLSMKIVCLATSHRSIASERKSCTATSDIPESTEHQYLVQHSADLPPKMAVKMASSKSMVSESSTPKTSIWGEGSLVWGTYMCIEAGASHSTYQMSCGHQLFEVCDVMRRSQHSHFFKFSHMIFQYLVLFFCPDVFLFFAPENKNNSFCHLEKKNWHNKTEDRL